MGQIKSNIDISIIVKKYKTILHLEYKMSTTTLNSIEPLPTLKTIDSKHVIDKKHIFAKHVTIRALICLIGIDI